MVVVLEHRAAAGRIDDDRIHASVSRRQPRAEGRAVLRRESPGGFFLGGVVVQRTAATLSTRYPHLAAVALEHPRGGERGLGEEGVAGAADEQSHPRPPFAFRRQHLGQASVVRPQTWEHLVELAEE